MASSCHSNLKCPLCGEKHTYEKCPKKETQERKCANCNGDHSAAFTGCPAFKEAKEIVTIKTLDKISFADAVKRVKGSQTGASAKQSDQSKITLTGPGSKIPTSMKTSSGGAQQGKAGQPKSPLKLELNTFVSIMVELLLFCSNPSVQKMNPNEKFDKIMERLKAFHLPFDLSILKGKLNEAQPNA